MRKFKNFIGNLLIGLARVIKFLHTVTLFVILIVFCLSILAATMIALFELIGRAAPDDLAYHGMDIDIFKHWYWDLVVFVIGSLTMWQGFTKMFATDKEFNENMKNYDSY